MIMTLTRMKILQSSIRPDKRVLLDKLHFLKLLQNDYRQCIKKRRTTDNFYYCHIVPFTRIRQPTMAHCICISKVPISKTKIYDRLPCTGDSYVSTFTMTKI